MKLRLKVKPNSRNDEIAREADGSLKVKILAQPVEGKANRYLIEYLSRLLNLSKSKITLLKGKSSSFKTVEIDADEKAVNEKFSKY